MIKSNALRVNYDPENNKPKSNKGYKWINILSDIWGKRRDYEGEGKGEGEGAVFIPSDPNALIERLGLLLASQEAGNTGVGNELVSICDELKRQGLLNSDDYKKLISNIKK